MLVAAHQRGERFDRDTGEPVSWQPRTDPMQVHAWVRCWVAEQWPEWQPRTRASAVEAMARFVPLLVRSSVAAPAPDGLRRYLMDTLGPAGQLAIPRSRPPRERLTILAEAEPAVDVGQQRTVELVELRAPAGQPPLTGIGLLEVARGPASAAPSRARPADRRSVASRTEGPVPPQGRPPEERR